MKFKAVISELRFHDYEIERKIIENAGGKLICASSTQEFHKLSKEADAVLLNLSRVDEALIDEMKNCKVISRYGVGCDNVDLDACKRRGIKLCNVPDYCSQEVAEHALALALAGMRNLSFSDRKMRRGGWDEQPEKEAATIKGSTVGVFGFGRTAKAFINLCSAFEPAHILVSSPGCDEREAAIHGLRLCTKQELIEKSAVISLHVPLTNETFHILDKEDFAAMREDCCLVNCSRGAVINEAELLKALDKGRPAFAGLDVFETEPPDKNSPLLSHEKVLMSAHSAWRSSSSIKELRRRTAQNAVDILLGKAPEYIVV